MQINRQTLIVIGIAAVGLLIAGLLVHGIWEQVELLNRIQASRDELEPLLVRENDRNTALLIELKHVSSPEYPEEFSRVYVGVTGEDEVRVYVDLPPETSTAAPAPQVELSFWQRLWQWLSGETN